VPVPAAGAALTVAVGAAMAAAGAARRPVAGGPRWSKVGAVRSTALRGVSRSKAADSFHTWSVMRKSR
jgi:hypothetical protein